MPFRTLLAAVLAAISSVPSLGATSVVALSFDDLVRTAREIFVSQVVSSESHWIATSDGRTIVTTVTVDVSESLKGDTPSRTQLEFLGGTVGNVTLKIDDIPVFMLGDRDVLFVSNRNAVSPITGFTQGRFRVVTDANMRVDSVRTHDGRSIPSTASIGRLDLFAMRTVQSLSLDEFRQHVLAVVNAQRSGR